MSAAAVFAVGLALLVAGAALVYLPAAFIVAGASLMLGAWFYVRGQRTEEP